MPPVIHLVQLPPVEAVRVGLLTLDVVQRVDEEVGPAAAAVAREGEAGGRELDVVVPVVDVGPVVAVPNDLGLEVLGASAGELGSVGGVAVIGPPVVTCQEGKRGVRRYAGVVGRKNIVSTVVVGLNCNDSSVVATRVMGSGRNIEGGVVAFELRDGREHGFRSGNVHLVGGGGLLVGRDDGLGPRIGDDSI